MERHETAMPSSCHEPGRPASHRPEVGAARQAGETLAQAAASVSRPSPYPGFAPGHSEEPVSLMDPSCMSASEKVMSGAAGKVGVRHSNLTPGAHTSADYDSVASRTNSREVDDSDTSGTSPSPAQDPAPSGTGAEEGSVSHRPLQAAFRAMRQAANCACSLGTAPKAVFDGFHAHFPQWCADAAVHCPDVAGSPATSPSSEATSPTLASDAAVKPLPPHAATKASSRKRRMDVKVFCHLCAEAGKDPASCLKASRSTGLEFWRHLQRVHRSQERAVATTASSGASITRRGTKRTRAAGDVPDVAQPTRRRSVHVPPTPVVGYPTPPPVEQETVDYLRSVCGKYTRISFVPAPEASRLREVYAGLFRQGAWVDRVCPLCQLEEREQIWYSWNGTGKFLHHLNVAHKDGGSAWRARLAAAAAAAEAREASATTSGQVAAPAALGHVQGPGKPSGPEGVGRGQHCRHRSMAGTRHMVFPTAAVASAGIPPPPPPGPLTSTHSGHPCGDQSKCEREPRLPPSVDVSTFLTEASSGQAPSPAQIPAPGQTGEMACAARAAHGHGETAEDDDAEEEAMFQRMKQDMASLTQGPRHPVLPQPFNAPGPWGSSDAFSLSPRCGAELDGFLLSPPFSPGRAFDWTGSLHPSVDGSMQQPQNPGHVALFFDGLGTSAM